MFKMVFFPLLHVTIIIVLLLCVAKGSSVDAGNQTASTVVNNNNDLIFSDYDTETAIKAYIGGFNTYRSNKLLLSILSNPEIQLDATYSAFKTQIFNVNDKIKILASDDYHYHDYDLAFIYINNYELLNDNVILERFQRCFESIIECNHSKTPLVIIFSGLSDEADKVEYLLKEAWVLLDKDKYDNIKDDSLFTKFDVQIILTPSYLREGESVNVEAIKAVKEAINDVSVYSQSLDDYLKVIQSNNINVSSSIDNPINGTLGLPIVNKVHGVEVLPFAVSTAVEWALKATNDSIVRLNRLESPENFCGFIENLIKASNEILAAEFKAAYAINDTSSRHNATSSNRTLKAVTSVDYSNILSISRQELHAKIYLRLAPLYKRQVQLLRNEIASTFNDIVTNQIDVSIYIMDDLYEARDKILTNFTNSIKRLTPRDAPKSRWNADFEVFELKQTLNDYLATRKSFYQLSGVLARDNRIPVDISFHILALHPLGRDYRQDPLGFSDLLVYNTSEIASSALSKNRNKNKRHGGLMSPLLARQKLQQIIKTKQDVLKGSELRRLRKNSEFAREMLMLPLSIKHPDTPMSSGGRGGGRKKSSIITDASANAEKRYVYGPERFIRWDIEPLDEVKRNLERGMTKSSSSSSSKKDVRKDYLNDALNLIPVFSKGFYRHPPINYGVKYSPSSSTVN